jgi:glutamyl-Q tRNA(Asp) synthetase
MYQSQRARAYDRALEQLASMGLLFACDCTRQRLGPGGCCGGRCRPRQSELEEPVALRVAIPPGVNIAFDDRLQGPQAEDFGANGADFVVRRKDGYYAYQLAVVVDDAEQDISDVVRGSDLLDSTPRQIWLQRQLGYPTPRYMHLPVLNDACGRKLSKQNRAPALDTNLAPLNLRRCLAHLGQPTPPHALGETADILRFAARHWSPHALPRRVSLVAEPEP